MKGFGVLLRNEQFHHRSEQIKVVNTTKIGYQRAKKLYQTQSDERGKNHDAENDKKTIFFRKKKKEWGETVGVASIVFVRSAM